MKDFCVYAHLTADQQQIFYIGKGRTKRAHSKSNRTKFWRHVVNKHGLEVWILHSDLTDVEAINLEAEYIQLIGRRNIGQGPLINLTDGGQGMSGFVLTPDHRRKVAESMRRVWLDPEYSLQASKASILLWQSEEYREKQRRSQTGKKRSIESRKRMSEAQLLLAKDPTHVEWRSKATKKRWADPVYRSMMAKRSKDRWQDPEFRKKASLRMRGSRKKTA